MVVLTNQRTPSHSQAKFPTAQLLVLALCRLAEPIALCSIFPYAWPMVKGFLGESGGNASFWSGILISSFALAEACTGMYWGGLSDRIGRKPVLLLGCTGTMLSMLLMGFSTNLPMAIFARALGGLLNGNIGVIQTMVGELVTVPEHEPKAYAVMPFVWSVGSIIGPAISASACDTGIFLSYPYLLPNLICAGLLLLSIVVGYFFLVETHPDLGSYAAAGSQDERDVSTAGTPLMATAGATDHAGADLRAESYGTFNRVDIVVDTTWKVNADGSSPASSIYEQERQTPFTRKVVMLVTALGFFSYHSMVFDNLLPIFLQDDLAGEVSAASVSQLDMEGGLGLTTRQVGVIMSVNGLNALFVQAVVFPLFASWLGVWRLFQLTVLCHPIVYFLVPFLVLLPSASTYAGIYGVLTIRNLFSIILYPVILILLKEVSPKPSFLGKINGLAASVGAVARTIAPPLSGLLYGVGEDVGFTGLAWWVTSALAVAGAVQMLWIRRTKRKTSFVRTACSRPIDEMPENDKDVVRIKVQEIEEP